MFAVFILAYCFKQVNNAGAATGGNFEQSSVDDMDWMYKVNVRTVYVMTKAALPHIKKTKGKLFYAQNLWAQCSFCVK